MSKNQEFHTRQELIVELYNHTMRQLCRDNIGDFKDGIAMFNTLAVLVASPHFPATFTTRDIDLLAGETIALCEKEDKIAELDEENGALIKRVKAYESDLEDRVCEIDALESRIDELEKENMCLRLSPQPIECWSDEKKQIYAEEECRSVKSGYEHKPSLTDELRKECEE